VGAACHTGERTCFDADLLLALDPNGDVASAARAGVAPVTT
jgi:hypothetical protein